jgi:Dyp-type peroxidase family
MTTETKSIQLNFSDIQGYIVRGYNMNYARYFVLKIEEAKAAKKFIGNLVSGDESTPQITTAAFWDVKPSHCLNIGFTFQGLEALKFVNVDEAFAHENYDSFRAGAIAQAEVVGDIGESSPSNWKGGLGTSDAHILLSLFANDSKVLEEQSDKLRSLFQKEGALKELSCFDGAKLPDENGQPSDTVHFGYNDGISQPIVEGFPTKRGLAESGNFQPITPAHYFILLNSGNYKIPEPPDLGLNGSFAAFRVLEQDVVGFDKFLQDQKDKIDPEKLAAKMCGRWRNGVPLDMSPDADQLPPPDEPITYEQFNDFDYSGDKQGYKCPIGSHIRRTYPRKTKIIGDPEIRRLIRRGIPYGPPYNPNSTNDGIERGLLGLFICAGIESQFEFVMEEWVNKGEFAGIYLAKDAKDPLLGVNDNNSGQLEIRVKDQPPIKLQGFERFITTKGGAYCFLPSITALKFIANNSITG